MIECRESLGFRPLAAHERGDRFRRRMRVATRDTTSQRGAISRSQTLVVHDASSACCHPMPISLSRVRRSASPR